MHIRVTFYNLPPDIVEELIEKDINFNKDDDDPSITIDDVITSIVPRVGDYFSYTTSCGVEFNGKVVYVNISVNEDDDSESIFVAVQHDNDYDDSF